MRKFLTWMVSGALAGMIVATIAAPYVLETLLASTGAKDAMCQCTELVNNTARLLIKTQLWGGVVGAVLFPLGAWLARRQFGRPSTPGAAKDGETVGAPGPR
jgi:hypothetical protein